MTGIWQPIGAPGERFLNRVVIDVTSKCNLSCAMCNRPDNDFDMPLELFGKIALETFPFTRSVWLSCGYEAFMARDFLAMAGYLKSAPDSLIITNGTLLNERNIRALIDSGLTRMVISFDGARKETFERIRKGSQFERVIANIGLLNRLKDALGSATPELLLTVTLMKSNLGEFADIVRQAAGLGIRTVKAKPLFVKVPSMGGEALEQCRDSARRSIAEARAAAQQLGICLEEALELKGLMENDRAGATAGPQGPQSFTCNEMLPTLFILPDGKVNPCSRWTESAVGDFTRQSFADIWNGSAIRDLLRGFDSGQAVRESCRRCGYLGCM